MKVTVRKVIEHDRPETFIRVTVDLGDGLTLNCQVDNSAVYRLSVACLPQHDAEARAVVEMLLPHIKDKLYRTLLPLLDPGRKPDELVSTSCVVVRG